MAGNNGSSAATFYFNNKQDCQLSPDSEDTLRPAAELLASYYELGLEGSGCVEMADRVKTAELLLPVCLTAVHWRLLPQRNCRLHKLRHSTARYQGGTVQTLRRR